MPADKTTDITPIRTFPRRFSWGTVIQIHDVGPSYTIVEFLPIRRGEEVTEQEHLFHVYVDGKDCCVSTTTLDGALILAMSRKNLEPNKGRYMAMAACKLLGVNEPE